MSLLRKIRRQHKAFVLKRSTQINGHDKASSVSSVDNNKDGEEHEDEDADWIAESLQQADVQNFHVSIAASPSHETQQILSLIDGYSVHTGAQSLICIPTGVVIDKDAGMNFVGKEHRFWPRIAKTAAFLLVTAGAFLVGKLTAFGFTLAVALACKLFARCRINKCESLISAGTGESCRSYESLPSSSEFARLDSESELSDESKILFVSPLGNAAIDTNGYSQMDVNAIGHDQSEETLSMKATGDLVHRKQLKRLNCINLPPPASPSIEAMDDSQSSSAKASPRTWFRNAARSMATGKDIVAEMNKQGKFKSKVFLSHLRKGDPQSAPSSPLRSSQEASHSFCVVSNGSDTERPAHPVHRTSKVRPVSPIAKEASRVDVDMVSSLKKGEKKQSRETMSSDVHTSLFQRGEGKPLSFMPATPTSVDATAKSGIHAPSASTLEQSHRRRGRHQCTWKPLTPASQDASRANAFVSANQDSLRGSVQKGGEKNQQQVRVGALWVASGLVITVAGLFMGRTVAIAGLVSYWYALSLKRRKASGRRKGN